MSSAEKEKESGEPRVDGLDDVLSPSGVSNVDDAWKFLDKHRDAANVQDDADNTVNILAIRRKIDWRIVPLGFLCYMMQFTDKLVLNVNIYLSHLPYPPSP